MPINLEIPVFSPSSALHAQALGAQRIELNARGSYPAGGTTPTLADLEGVTKWLTVPLRIMIRPRGKPADDVDFVYGDDELAAMASDVEAFRAALRADRGDGFVFGALRRDGAALAVDVEANRRLVEATGGLACSFHRASGGPGTAAANRKVLEVVVRKASAGARRLEVILGGGVRKENVGKVVGGLGDGVWAHSSCYAGKCEEAQVDDEEAMGILERLAEK